MKKNSNNQLEKALNTHCPLQEEKNVVPTNLCATCPLKDYCYKKTTHEE